jgi:hypothetical protein
MTVVETEYELAAPLDENFGGIARVHGVYGILRVRVAPSLDKVKVEYDASRLSLPAVEDALIGAGVPVKRKVPLAPA